MLKTLLWSFLEQSGSKLVALVVQIVLARLLAPEAFGVLAIMLVVFEVCNTLSQSGLGMALIQSRDAGDLQCDTALWLSVGVAGALYLAVFLSAPLLAGFYGTSELAAYLRVMALAVPLNAVNSVQRSLLQKNMDFKSLFKANMAAVCGAGALGVGLALAGAGVWALVVQSLAQAALACAVMLRHVPWRPRLRFDGASARALFSYGWKVMATGLLNTVYNGVSELILGKVCAPADLGLYSQGRKWPNAGIAVVTNSVQNVMFPAFAELQDRPEELARMVRRALAAGTLVVAPMGTFLAAAAGPLVELLLGEAWLACVPVFQLASLSALFMILQLVNLRAYMALGDSGLYLRLQAVKVAASCAVIWPVAALTRDIYWTALAVFVSGLFCVVLVDLRPAKRMHGVGALEQLRTVAPAVAACLAAGAAAWAVALAGLPAAATLASQAAVFLGLYAGAARLAGLPGADDVASMARSLLAGRAR